MTKGHADVEHANAGKRQQKKSTKAFARGFARGFGSVGYVFLAADPLPSQSRFVSHLINASAAERRNAINTEKQRIAARYMGPRFAARFFLTSEEHVGRLHDSLMIRRDFANAILKQHA